MRSINRHVGLLFRMGERYINRKLAGSGVSSGTGILLLELRDATVPATVVASRSALLQRDGDIVGTDGTSSPIFNRAPGNYYLSVRHRNHLGCMSAAALSLPTTPLQAVNFSSAATNIFGTEARKSIAGTFPTLALWAGNTNFNTEVKYTGTANDRDPILTTVGSTTPNNLVSGYALHDVNLDGMVLYTGNGNDRDPILVNVGSTTPNNIRAQQLP